MTSNEEQAFLNSLDKKLWNAADKLRSNIDAAEYKHVVLGLIFLKYVSDSFEERREELIEKFRNLKDDYYLGDDADDELINAELEIRDYYTEKNIFWVPQLARWQFIQDNAKLPPGTKIEVTNGKKHIYEIRSVNRLLDDALEAIEKENPKLKNILNKQYTSRQIDSAILGSLIDEIAKIPFHHETLKSKDILGHVYEYFLGQFALAEGKKGGQYFTPKSIVRLIVEMLQPYKGRVYDPAMGSGGFFVQSLGFIESHAKQYKNKKEQQQNLSIYGQESNPTTWRLAAMNMVIRGIDFKFGKENANSFSNDQHPDLRADFVMANPPFNMKEWNKNVSDEDPRWKYGIPPVNNANYAWMQHMLYHLAPNGCMALLLANGSMSSNTSNEGQIRKNLIEDDKIECIVALPGQLFTNTQIPACIWFLTKNKKARNGYRDRTGEVLFIDARKLGYMKDRVLRDFTNEDIATITGAFYSWRYSNEKGNQDISTYEDVTGFCKSEEIEALREYDYVLTPGRYVGAAEVEVDGEPFAEKMARLTMQLKDQVEESDSLEVDIKKNFERLGYEI